MTTPHIIRLAQIDNQRFVAACRSGLVHLTWGRITVRLTRDEFRQWASLVQQAADFSSPASVSHGLLRITARPDEDCELQVGPLILLLSPAEFRELVAMAGKAIDGLDQILASGMWDRQEPEDVPPGPLEQMRHFSFSRN